MSDFTPEWTKAPMLVPLVQAFPDFGDVKSYRNRLCLFNHDRSRLYNVVSSKYYLVRHKDLMDAVEKAFRLVWPGCVPTCTVRSDKAGARITALYEVPWVGDIVVGQHDPLKVRIEVQNSYDSSWALSLGVNLLRLACTNGMYVGSRCGGVNGKHFPALERVTAIAATLEDVARNVSMMGRVYTEWAEEPAMDFDEARRLVPASTFPVKYEARIMQPSRFPRTKWDLYNDFTAMASHQVRSLNRRLEFDRTIADLFFGPDERMFIAPLRAPK